MANLSGLACMLEKLHSLKLLINFMNLQNAIDVLDGKVYKVCKQRISFVFN